MNIILAQCHASLALVFSLPYRLFSPKVPVAQQRFVAVSGAYRRTWGEKELKEGRL
jgi:hypothetical protein